MGLICQHPVVTAATETGATGEPAAVAAATTIRHSETAAELAVTVAVVVAVPPDRVMAGLAVTAAHMAVVVELMAQPPAAGALTAETVEPKDKMETTAQTRLGWDWNLRGPAQVEQKEQ